jgi:hypothetical protein
MTATAAIYLALGIFLVILVLILALPGILSAFNAYENLGKKRELDPHSLFPSDSNGDNREKYKLHPSDFQETNGRRR